MKQYTVILPDVIKARSEEEAYDAFLQYMGICHLMGDVTCFDFVEVKPTTKQQHRINNMNMTPHHTPAPWTLTFGRFDAAIYNDGTIASIDDTMTEWKANARLIAQAPAMLSALRAIAARVAEDRATVESLGYCYTDSAEGDCADIAREAIALATPRVDHPPHKEIPIPEGHIFKAASLYLSEWPDEWTEAELLAAIRNEDYENITVCEAHELQPMDDIAQWIEDAARAFS